MEHESMVHALDEIRRTLKPNGILIDLRPVASNWSVGVSSSAGYQLAGRLNDMPVGLADDEAAFKAMSEVESRRWYIKEKEEEFAFFYYWDTPSEMKEFMETEWEDFEKMEEDVFQKTKSLWVSANADARVRVHVKMLITKWKRT
jgi:SAM-dependent methyltransferase